MTQKEAAKLIGISSGRYSKLENPNVLGISNNCIERAFIVLKTRKDQIAKHDELIETGIFLLKSFSGFQLEKIIKYMITKG